jgi:hypothetical protein
MLTGEHPKEQQIRAAGLAVSTVSRYRATRRFGQTARNRLEELARGFKGRFIASRLP